jgi:hypothetical protein
LRPYHPLWSDDFEDVPVGSYEFNWTFAAGVMCVEHLGSHWMMVGSPADAYKDYVTGRCGRWCFDIDVLELEVAEGHDDAWIRVMLSGTGVRFRIVRQSGDVPWVIEAGTWALVSTLDEDPRGAPHHCEAVHEDGVLRLVWDDREVLTESVGEPLNVQGVAVDISHAASADIRLDNFSIERLVQAGSWLARDRNSVARVSSRWWQEWEDKTFAALAFGGLGYGAELALPGVYPTVAALGDGSRLFAAQTDAGVALTRKSLVHTLQGGSAMTLDGHRHPALCALAERGSFLLVTVCEDALLLTSGRVTVDGVSLDLDHTRTIASGDVGEATAGIIALPDSTLVVCYHNGQGDTVQVMSRDGGATWE